MGGEKMRYVFVFVESDLRGKFFYRFKNALTKKTYKLVIITSCPTVWYRAKREGDIVFLLGSGKSKQYDSIPLEREVLEVCSGEISAMAAQVLASYWVEKIQQIAIKYPPVLCLIYNGTTLLPYVGKWWAQNRNIKSLFFELANIPGKMFVDKWGTNAKSYLYSHPEILNQYKVSDIEYKKWKNEYFGKKATVKQAAFSSQVQSVVLFALNHLYFACLLPGSKNKITYIRNWCCKFIKRYKSKQQQNENLPLDISTCKPYYLFPMQVTADSQVLLNSDISLIEAIGIAMKKSEQDGVKLVIKPHPAELDKTIYTKIQKLYPQAIIMNGDIKKMIREAEKIITINSTVGLESILMGQKVEFLGRSFYQCFMKKREWLPKYILGYLVNIDYFGTNEITGNTLEECLRR